MLRVLFVSILWNVVSSAKSDCVDDYLHFEKLTFSNNSENRLKLYQAFYPINKHLPYSVVVTYQTGSSNGTRRNISTDSSCPNEQVWMWLSSPVFLFAEPTFANRLTLYALNYFEDWHPQQLLINIPTPCEGNAEELLKQMTRSVGASYHNRHVSVTATAHRQNTTQNQYHHIQPPPHSAIFANVYVCTFVKAWLV